MQSHIRKWGNSLGVRIPKAWAEKIRLQEGTRIHLQLENDTIVIHPKRDNLENLLSQVTPNNVHEEVNTGDSVGREIE
jgi:antitoxin MazE